MSLLNVGKFFAMKFNVYRQSIKMIYFPFADIATVVGFFAVSLPFLDSSHEFTGLSKDERFRVSFSDSIH